MNISDNSVVSFEYTLRSDAGEVLDSSEDGGPMTYLHGHDQIVPGLEQAMEGRKKGDKFEVKVAAKDGYGERDEDAIFDVPRDRLPEGMPVEVGMELASQTPSGEPLFLRVVKVGADKVTMDANHPLAGENLNFAIEVTEVRAATAEEVRHGHVHGEGGHEH
ncbi:MAG: peptidylprolyl isomerase [Myxococcota bacterium]